MTESIAIIFVAFAGFLLALYLFHKKRRKSEPFICPMKANCSDVIQSDYSKFLGIPVEILGMLYYGLLAIGHGIFIVNTSFEWLGVILLLVSSVAFLFSLYLTAIQVFALKKFCTWCLLSATFCLTIFVLTLFSSLKIVTPLLTEYHVIIEAVHLFAVGIGAGIATTTTVFFYQFLRDGHVSIEESKILSTMFEIGWLSLGILLVFGSAIFLSDPQWLSHIPLFTAELLAAIGVVIGTGFLTLKVIPKFVRISSGKTHEHEAGEILLAQKRVFTFGPVSLVSWYATFLFSLFPERFSHVFGYLIIGYIIVMFISAVIGRLTFHTRNASLNSE